MTPEAQAYIRDYLREWKRRRRAAAIAHLEHKHHRKGCFDCGGTDRLEFDHVDPSTKVASIADMMTAREEVFWSEVNKCVLRCYECHKKKSSRMGDFRHRSAPAQMALAA